MFSLFSSLSSCVCLHREDKCPLTSVLWSDTNTILAILCCGFRVPTPHWRVLDGTKDVTPHQVSVLNEQSLSNVARESSDCDHICCVQTSPKLNPRHVCVTWISAHLLRQLEMRRRNEKCGEAVIIVEVKSNLHDPHWLRLYNRHILQSQDTGLDAISSERACGQGESDTVKSAVLSDQIRRDSQFCLHSGSWAGAPSAGGAAANPPVMVLTTPERKKVRMADIRESRTEFDGQMQLGNTRAVFDRCDRHVVTGM